MIIGPTNKFLVACLGRHCSGFRRCPGGRNAYHRMLLGILIWGLILISPASATDGLLGVMQALSGVERSEVRYQEEKHLAMLDLPLLQTGRLSYVAPDHLSRSLDEPAGSRFTVHGDQVTLYKKTGKDTHDLNSLPMIKAFVAAFGATLSGDLPRLQRYYEVGFNGGLSEWRLILQPRNSRLASHVSEILLWGAYDKIKGMEIQEVNGDWSRMILLHD